MNYDKTFRRILFPIAIAWTVINLAWVPFAAMAGEAMHASIHGALALAFGLWAYRLRKPAAPVAIERDARTDVLENEIEELRRALSEKQEGLDFAEQLLAKRPESRPQPKPPAPSDHE